MFGYANELRRVDENLLEGDDVWVVELAKMSDVCFFEVADFLYGHLFLSESAKEDSALCPTAQPLQVRDVLKWNVPAACNHRELQLHTTELQIGLYLNIVHVHMYSLAVLKCALPNVNIAYHK